MINTWYHPSWCGDYRLEKVDDSTCLLTVVDPVPAEIGQIGKLIKAARKKKWVTDIAGVAEKGKSELRINAPIGEAGLLLLNLKAKDVSAERQGILTTIVSESGTVKTIDGAGEDVALALTEEEEGAAVTTKRPTLCCPSPCPGPEERASEVLRRFSTTSQWRSWLANGFLHCVGNLSGRLYRIAHRHSRLAIKQGKVAWDVAGKHIMHCHASNLPPAEEALAIKLTLEHREHWIRNRSGCLRGREDIYVNPFMTEDRQIMDGTSDAELTSFMAGFVPVIAGAGGLRI